MSNLYHLESLFLINIEKLKDADKKTVKKMHKRINKFKTEIFEIYDAYAVPTTAKLPIPLTQMVGYGEINPMSSFLISENNELIDKMNNENSYPILVSNVHMACSYEAFPSTYESNKQRIKFEIYKIAKKLKLEGEMYTNLYETIRESKSITQGYENKDVRVVSNYEGRFDDII